MLNKIHDKIPIISLVILSPLIAELLSGSAPPLEFFNPISFFVLLGMYGCGVLIIREYSIKFDIGFVCIIILGIAYGVIEEGLAVKSFFDPEWMDLGILGVLWKMDWCKLGLEFLFDNISRNLQYCYPNYTL